MKVDQSDVCIKSETNKLCENRFEYTPEVEAYLIEHYNTELVPKHISQLNHVINYTDELSEVILEGMLHRINHQSKLYGEYWNLKEDGNKIGLFKSKFGNQIILMVRQIINYLDPSSPDHQRQVELNGAYWERLLVRAKRQYLIKELL